MSLTATQKFLKYNHSVCDQTFLHLIEVVSTIKYQSKYMIDNEEVSTNITKYHLCVWNRQIMQISWSVSREITVENQTLNQSSALSALT